MPDAGPVLVDGPAGAMEVIFDRPRSLSCGVAIVAHPQPLLGGSASHKVPHVLARALCEAGWLVARPNFRGVGRSAGVHDEGRGESDDLIALADQLREQAPGQRLALVGFSFGAYVQARVADALTRRGVPPWRTCLVGLPWGEVDGARCYQPPGPQPGTLVVHGERDDRVPLGAVLDWARPHGQPVVVVPGTDHYFTGRLPVLRGLVVGHLRG